MYTREQQRRAQSNGGDRVAVTPRRALDETMPAESAEVRGHPLPQRRAATTSNSDQIVQQLKHDIQNLLAYVMGPDVRSQTASMVKLTLFRRLLALGVALLWPRRTKPPVRLGKGKKRTKKAVDGGLLPTQPIVHAVRRAPGTALADLDVRGGKCA